MKVEINMQEQKSVSASNAYKVTSRGILVNPIAATMFKHFADALRTAAKAQRSFSRKEETAKKKFRAARPETPEQKAILKRKKDALQAEREKVKQLGNAMTDAKQSAGIRWTVGLSGSTVVAKIKGRSVPFRVVSQKVFDAAK